MPGWDKAGEVNGKPLAYKPRVGVAWPGRPNVPSALHAEFIWKLGGEYNEADAKLHAWYPDAARPFDGQPIGDDDFTFWRARFKEWLGTTVKPPSLVKRSVAPMPTYSERWCEHDPPCPSRDWHDVMTAKEGR